MPPGIIPGVTCERNTTLWGHRPRWLCRARWAAAGRGGRAAGRLPPAPGPGRAPHLAQLLTRGPVLGSLAQVLHALVLGQEILLLGIHLVTVPLVEQFAVGAEGGTRGWPLGWAGAGGPPESQTPPHPGVAPPWRKRVQPGPRLLTVRKLKKWGFKKSCVSW